ncbi:MAG: PKD domain-containing protein [Rhizobacter sp.]
MRRQALSIARFLSVATLGLALAACGGDDAVVPDPPAPPTNPNPPGPPASEPGTPQGPTAAFTAPDTASANQVVVFDASASTSADGGALTYVWDFGDGQRGGGRTIARSFAAGGARTVTLMVIDAGQRSGSASRTLTVAAPTAGAPVNVTGKISGKDGTPIDGVSVSTVGSGASATSDATGKVSLAVPRATAVTLKLSKTGYADQFVQLELPTGTGSDAYFEAVQSPRDAALTLPDAAAGGSLSGRDGAAITVPAGAFVDASGTAVTGPVQISVTPVDATQSGGGGFPGRFDGIQADGTTTPIVSFGAVEFLPTSSAGKLQLAPGKTATIEVPLYGVRRPDGTALVAGDAIPLWSLDETTSMWIREGSGEAVASATSPSGLAMRATVSHLSWWNADLGFEPYGPQPDCRAASDIGIPEAVDNFANATICIMLAEIEQTLGGSGGTNGGRAKALADPAPPRFAGYSRRSTVRIGAGGTVPVPPDVNIRFTATALNGTWSGTKVVRGPVGRQEPVVVEMRPNATTETGVEAVTIPFDAVRMAQVGRIDQYRFTGTGTQFAQVTVTTTDINSTVTGGIRLLQGSTELGRATFGTYNTGTLRVALPANGSYVVAVTGETNVPGGYHIKIETPGTVITEALGSPFAVTKDIPALTRYRGTFTHAGTAAYFGLRNDRAIQGPEHLRILAADGSVVTSAGGSTPGLVSQTVVSLPPGAYTAEVVVADGEAVRTSISGEPTSWVPVGELAPLSGNTFRGMIDLVADRNGRPVIGYWDADMSATPRTAVLRLRRWTGTAWENVGTDQTVALGGGYCSTPAYVSVPRPRMASFAFDGANNPLLAYRIDQETGLGTSLSSTTVRRFANGSWSGVGPNDGKLPLTTRTAFACDDPPLVDFDAAGRPLVAYRSDAGVTVQRFDGTAWKGLADPTADSFANAAEDSGGGFALGLDANGQVWLALTDRVSAVVRRFNAQTSAWETVGPNGGTLSSAGTLQDFTGGRFVFGPAGATAFATYGSAALPGVSYRNYNMGVYRYDGTAWGASIYPLGSDEGALPFKDAVAVAPSGNDLLVGWNQGIRNDWFSPVVQRNTASSWAPVGGGIGEIPQFTRRGIQATSLLVTSPLLLQTGHGTYLATLVWPMVPNQPPVGYRLVLSRKVAD